MAVLTMVIILTMALLTQVRFKIMRNIGNSFVRLGQFQDAIASYEQAR